MVSDAPISPRLAEAGASGHALVRVLPSLSSSPDDVSVRARYRRLSDASAGRRLSVEDADLGQPSPSPGFGRTGASRIPWGPRPECYLPTFPDCFTTAGGQSGASRLWSQAVRARVCREIYWTTFLSGRQPTARRSLDPGGCGRNLCDAPMEGLQSRSADRPQPHDGRQDRDSCRCCGARRGPPRGRQPVRDDAVRGDPGVAAPRPAPLEGGRPLRPRPSPVGAGRTRCVDRPADHVSRPAARDWMGKRQAWSLVGDSRSAAVWPDASSRAQSRPRRMSGRAPAASATTSQLWTPASTARRRSSAPRSRRRCGLRDRGGGGRRNWPFVITRCANGGRPG